MKERLGYAPYQLILEALGLLLFLGGELYLLLSWSGLPSRLPTGYDLSGAIAAWGDASVLRGLGMASLVIYLSFTLLPLFPNAWQRKVRGNEQNREQVHHLMRTQFAIAKLFLLAAVDYLAWCTAHAAPLAGWVMPVLAGGLIVSVLGFRAVIARGGLTTASRPSQAAPGGGARRLEAHTED